MNKYFLIALNLAALYYLIKIVRFYLFSGFAPFINIRKSQAQVIISELSKEKLVADPIVYALGAGKAGFLKVLADNLPLAKNLGVENHLGRFILEKLQLLSRLSPIKLKFFRRIYHLKLNEANLIYCDLDLEDLSELPKKFKYECRPGTIVLSIGNPIPNLEEKRGFDLPPVKTFKERIFFWRPAGAGLKKDHGNSWVYLYEI
jgi:hypothetical protein